LSPKKPDHHFVWQFCLLLSFSIVIALLGTFKAPTHFLGNEQSRQQGYLLDQARVLFSTNPTLTAAQALQSSGKMQVTLPDSWDSSNKDFEGQSWYQIEFRIDSDKPKPDAVFLPKAVMNAHAYLNGYWIGGLGRLEGDISRHWNHPYLFQFSPELLTAGNNTLLIQVAGYKNYRSGLGRVWVGPQQHP
jgi:hypothetical protein